MKQDAAGNQPAPPVRWFFLGTIVFFVALGAGIFLRFSGVGRYGFWTDELFHVFAALSYLEDGSFHVPWSPNEYTRALPVTLLTALSFKLFGQSEAAARFVFALANVVFIIVAYRILKEWFSRNVALIFAISMALSVFAIQMSQECRMYTLFQLVYFLMSIALFQGLEHHGPPEGRQSRPLVLRFQSRVGVSFRYFAITLGLGLLAVWLQPLAWSFGLVVLVYCITMLAFQRLHKGPAGLLRSKYATVSILMAVGTMVLVVTQSESVGRLVGIALYKPGWNRLGQGNLAFYRQVLTDSHPILWSIYPLGAFLAIHKYGKRGLYFVLSFCVPFVLHCLVFRRASERYIFQLLPFFITVSAVAVEFVLSSIVTFASNHASRLSRWTRVLFYAAVLVSLTLIVYPRIQRTVLDTSIPKYSNWKDLDPAVIRTITQGPSVTTDRLRFNYYFGQYPNYVIDSSDVDHVGGERVIANLADFERVFARHPALYVVTYGKHMYNDTFVSSEIRDYILREMDRVDAEADGRIMVFSRPREETEDRR